MTNIETCADIRARNAKAKLYPGVMRQGQFSRYLIFIEKNMCKPATVEKFFTKFGYEGAWDNWTPKQ